MSASLLMEDVSKGFKTPTTYCNCSCFLVMACHASAEERSHRNMSVILLMKCKDQNSSLLTCRPLLFETISIYRSLSQRLKLAVNSRVPTREVQTKPLRHSPRLYARHWRLDSSCGFGAAGGLCACGWHCLWRRPQPSAAAKDVGFEVSG